MSLFNKLSLGNFKDTFKKVVFRFPVSLLAIIIVFILFSYLIVFNNLSDYVENILFKSIVSTIVVFFLSIWVALMSEALKVEKMKKILFQSGAIFFWVLFYYFFWGQTLDFIGSEEIVYIFLIFVWIISFLFFSPFVKKVLSNSFSQDVYYNYFLKISFTFLISFILGWALTLLWFIWIWATFALFDLDFAREGDFYSHFANFSLVFFTPFFFLSQLPKKTLTNKKVDIHSFFKFLIKYISIPFIFIYFFILYAYTIKVLLNFNDWPHWEVSWMVIWFSIFGYLIYIFSYWFEKENSFIKSFRKYFPLAVIFQLPMLFYAIYLRINQYDFTINRYFVVVFWLWLSFISFYLFFSKKKILAFIPIILFDVIVIISIWPWSVYNFPESRQISILNTKLIEANILVDNEIIIPEKSSDIEDKVSWKIYDIIWYLVNNHWILSLENVFPDLIKDIKEEYRKDWELSVKRDDVEFYWISKWELIDRLRTKLKVKAYYVWKNIDTKYINFRLDYNFMSNFLDVKWYDYVVTIWDLYRIGNTSKKDLFSVEYQIKDWVISILKSGIIIEEFDLLYEFDEFYKENKNNITNYWEVELEEYFISEKEWEKVNIKIILSNFSVLNPSYSWGNDYNSNSISWKILIREK